MIKLGNKLVKYIYLGDKRVNRVYLGDKIVSAIITAIPTFTATMTYNKNTQTASFNNYNADAMTVSGNTGKNAGTYTATFSLKPGYIWSDFTFEDKTVTWTIGKATGFITLSRSSFTLADMSATFTAIADDGEGTVTMSQSSTTYCTAVLSNGTVTVTPKLNGGTNTLTFSAAANTNYTAATATLTVTVAVPVTFTGANATITGTRTGDWVITVKATTTINFSKLAGPVDVFLVGGGGAGSTWWIQKANDNYYNMGGGGGGGGYTKTAKNVNLAVNTNYTATVGGGAQGGGTSPGGYSFFSPLDSTYRAEGGVTPWDSSPTHQGDGDWDGGAGGSGGGAGSWSNGANGGSNGGNGGGGTQNPGGTGQGTTTRAFGESSGTLYSGGGGAGVGLYYTGSSVLGTRGSGGSGGGGAGGENGTANTGGGGGGHDCRLDGGTYSAPIGSGGSGIVLIRNHRT